MGGLYGNAAATALEDLPEETRGLMSGILQQGCAFGYLLAAAFARGLSVSFFSFYGSPSFMFWSVSERITSGSVAGLT
jgi:SHS family lactate transporter-like MFS transporter